MCPEGRKSERLVLISSHNLPELSTLADYVLLLEGGRIVQQGSIGDLVATRQTDLRYELRLFEGDAAALAAGLAEHLQLSCEVADTRRIKVCCQSPQVVHAVLGFLTQSASQYRIREFREERTGLESIFYNQTVEGSPE